MYLLLGIRCARKIVTETWSQFGWQRLRMITYELRFRVCYWTEERGIVSVTDVRGDATVANFPWEWRGNAVGYPYGDRTGIHTAEIHARGNAAFCIVPKLGCGQEKHPWIKVTFFDNNTWVVTSGVV